MLDPVNCSAQPQLSSSFSKTAQASFRLRSYSSKSNKAQSYVEDSVVFLPADAWLAYPFLTIMCWL